MFPHLPNILLSIPRNPVTAVGLPLTLGFLSGSQTSKVVDSQWYKVCRGVFLLGDWYKSSVCVWQTLRVPPGRPPRHVFPVVWSLLYICKSHSKMGSSYVVQSSSSSYGIRFSSSCQSIWCNTTTEYSVNILPTTYAVDSLAIGHWLFTQFRFIPSSGIILCTTWSESPLESIILWVEESRSSSFII